MQIRQPRIKYPRTPHFPWSETIGSDDKRLSDDALFCGMRVIITEKMDGENTSVYNDGYHARSLDSAHKPYHSWLLSYLSQWQYLLKDGERICGEYLYAEHSIHYDNLKNYFLGFSAWNQDICLSWEDTLKRFEELNIETVPQLYLGIYNREKTIEIAKQVIVEGGESIVVRNADSFTLDAFPQNVAKYVRPNHVQTDKHWSYGIIKQNSLAE